MKTRHLYLIVGLVIGLLVLIILYFRVPRQRHRHHHHKKTSTSTVTSTATSLECKDGETDCDGKCVDTNTDVKNCGDCGKECGPDEICNKGTCCLPNTLPCNVGPACTPPDKVCQGGQCVPNPCTIFVQQYVPGMCAGDYQCCTFPPDCKVEGGCAPDEICLIGECMPNPCPVNTTYIHCPEDDAGFLCVPVA